MKCIQNAFLQESHDYGVDRLNHNEMTDEQVSRQLYKEKKKVSVNSRGLL